MNSGHLQTLYKHQGAELKSLKMALEQRDAQVEECETQLRREHLEASTSVSSFQQQITSLKGNFIRNTLPHLVISVRLPVISMRSTAIVQLSSLFQSLQVTQLLKL